MNDTNASESRRVYVAQISEVGTQPTATHAPSIRRHRAPAAPLTATPVVIWHLAALLVAAVRWLSALGAEVVDGVPEVTMDDLLAIRAGYSQVTTELAIINPGREMAR